MTRLFAAALLVATVTVAVTACGGAGAAPASPGVSGQVDVFAAASLTAAFQEIGAGFEKANPGATTVFNFGGSSSLAGQVLQGAPADVFASADEANLVRVVDGGAASGPVRPFAANRLVIVVPAGNPKGIRGLTDLAAPGLTVVLCAPAVPCGAYAQQALARAGARVTPRSQEQDVKAVVTRVGLGEADAGIAYATDVRAAGGRVQGVEIPAAQNIVAVYPVVALRGPHQAAGRAFTDYLLGAPAQQVLARHGFAKA